MSGNYIFLLYLFIFGIILVYAGYFSRKWVSDSSDFILAGREVSLIINVFGVMAIGFAGTIFALTPGLAIAFGFWAAVSWGIIYAVVGLSLYGLFFSGFIRNCGAQTLPEWLEMRFSSSVRYVVTIASILGLAGIMATNITSLASIITGYTGWPIWLAIGVCFSIILLFSYFSGLWAVTLTDFIQMLIGLVSVPTLIIVLVTKYGGISFLQNSWPGPNLWNAGIKGAVLPIFKLSYPSALSFVLVFACFLVWGNNYYWLRIASCRSARVAKWSYVIAGVLLVPIVFVPITLLGIYAASANPTLFAPIGKLPGAMAYGHVLKSFAPALASFLLIGVAAATLSTAATAHIGATSTAVRDIYQRIFRPDATAKDLLLPSKIILLVLGALVWLLCYYPGGPIYLVAFAMAWLGPPSILVLLGVLWPRFSNIGALWGTVSGIGTMVVLTFLELTGRFVISGTIHTGVAGFLVTAVVAIIVSLFTSPKYFGSSNWQIDPAKSSRENIELNDFDLKLLQLLRYGHNVMSELTDLLKVDSKISNEAVEKLDRGGYLKRLSLRGAKFFVFEITEKGLAALPALSAKEGQMARDGLRPLYIEFLKAVQESAESLHEIIKKEKLISLEVAGIVSHLARKGYVVEKGVWRRRLEITEQGQRVIANYS